MATKNVRLLFIPGECLTEFSVAFLDQFSMNLVEFVVLGQDLFVLIACLIDYDLSRSIDIIHGSLHVAFGLFAVRLQLFVFLSEMTEFRSDIVEFSILL